MWPITVTIWYSRSDAHSIISSSPSLCSGNQPSSSGNRSYQMGLSRYVMHGPGRATGSSVSSSLAGDGYGDRGVGVPGGLNRLGQAAVLAPSSSSTMSLPHHLDVSFSSVVFAIAAAGNIDLLADEDDLFAIAREVD
ncbi:hypothetical protein TKK_0008157 [Trichogramma kaykai]